VQKYRRELEPGTEDAVGAQPFKGRMGQNIPGNYEDGMGLQVEGNGTRKSEQKKKIWNRKAWRLETLQKDINVTAWSFRQWTRDVGIGGPGFGTNLTVRESQAI